MSFNRLGQLSPTVTWEDGSLDTPDRVLSECDECGALVVAGREDAHAAKHEVTE
ncbi:hypothetical protein [Curtobacterium flaccumfaciens]|uniref:hypothetical protein n=1 Tax=Curtobacterium flaccumfaciens TaxID=2035 RepID=UPI001BDE989C|nr:hypothetical protein [Curtobacterium flaccumfaciens]MBT1633771.1 hypothetical protein [Curtobacterium flaccumfaciens pv. oortii]MCX2845575.1 hypothetical protein [Curtobacterium flaccumfaciens pv. oortii]